VPVAEEIGLIVPMGEAVLEEACRWAVRWQEEHPRLSPLLMNVNLSAKQLQRPDLITTVEGVLQRTGLDPASLTLDITETVYVKVLERNTAALNDLRRLGVKISIDDFGVGYSSLSYLKRLPADILKLDKSFVEGVGEDLEDTAIVRMIIDLARTLGLEVIAEGVESEAVTILREMGCGLAQGSSSRSRCRPKSCQGSWLRNPSSAIRLFGEAPSTKKLVKSAILLFGVYLTRYQ
jgi:EAL domain-containing protein (putative c-di-GMP-specific phosphodiesterase class I)